MNIKNFLPLSYSSINTYETCPYKWKLLYVDKIPTAPKAYLSFGTVVHEILKYILEGPFLPTLESVKNQYKLKWFSEGYRTKEEELKYFNEGMDIITNFYKEIENNPPSTLKVEFPLLGMIGDVPFHGILDRVDKAKGNKLEIIDYKTTKKGYSHTDMMHNEQFLVYQILAEEHFGKEIDKHTVYNLRTLSKISINRFDFYKVKEFENKVEMIVDMMESEFFEPQKNPYCNTCDYKPMCPLFNANTASIEIQKRIESYLSNLQKIRDLEDENVKIKEEIIQNMSQNNTYALRYNDIILKLHKRRGIYFSDKEVQLIKNAIKDYNNTFLNNETIQELIANGIISFHDLKKSLKKINYTTEFDLSYEKQII